MHKSSNLTSLKEGKYWPLMEKLISDPGYNVVIDHRASLFLSLHFIKEFV